MGKHKKTETEEALTQKVDTTKNLLGSLLKGYKEDHYNFIKNEQISISTGSLLLDYYVKLKTGSVCRLAGGLESGKTSQCLLLMSNYLQTIPKSRGLYIKAEGRLSEEIQKRSGLKFVYSEEEWDYGTIFVLESNIFEVVCDIVQGLLKNMHQNGERLAFCIDSLDGLILRADLEGKKDEDGKITHNPMPAGVPKMTKMFFRKLALPINKYDALALLTSQYSETFKIDRFAKDKPQPVQGVGGSAVSHQPDWILEYGVRYTSHYIKEKPKEAPDPVTNKYLGHTASITLRKSTNEKTGATVKIPIKYGQVGNCIWRSMEVGDMILAWSMAKKEKNTYKFEPSVIKEAKDKGIELEETFVGESNFYEYLDKNKEVCDWFYNKFQKAYFQESDL